MSNIFKTIGDTLSGLFKGSTKAEGVDKTDILNLIDNNLVLLKVVINTFNDNLDVMKYIKTTLIPQSGLNKDNLGLRDLYSAFAKELTNTGRIAENKLIFQSIRDAAVLALADHEKLRDNFTSLFDQGTDVSEIQIEQLKLSHAAIFGYINLSTLMCDWFCFFYTNLIGQPGETIRVPAYREKIIKSSSRVVAEFVSDVLARGTQRGIVDVVSGIRAKGDVTLYSDAATLDSYANINDYPGAMKLFDNFSVFQPILLVREWFTLRTHNKYKRNVALREWMLTKTYVLRMDMNGIDPDSPEYQRQLAILNKYSDEIAKLDKLISEYENS